MLPPTEFLQYCACKSTCYTYEAALKRYMSLTNPSAKATLDEQWIKYLTETKPQEIARDLITFSQKCQTENPPLAPKTISLYSRIVCLYLRECGIELSTHHQRLLRKNQPNNYPITQEYELTTHDIQTILKHADCREHAEILIAISSGMRIGELLQITENDIDLETKPAEIHIPASITKTRMPRTVFISHEAAESLNEWLIIRRNTKYHPDDKRIFPYSKSNEITRLNLLLKKSGLYTVDTRTRRSMIHFHLFRKFFLTEFKLSASAEVAEELAGHTGYLSTSYRRISHKTMQEEYLKAEPRLTIVHADESWEVSKTIHDELSQMRQEIMQIHQVCLNIQKQHSNGISDRKK